MALQEDAREPSYAEEGSAPILCCPCRRRDAAQSYSKLQELKITLNERMQPCFVVFRPCYANSGAEAPLRRCLDAASALSLEQSPTSPFQNKHY